MSLDRDDYCVDTNLLKLSFHASIALFVRDSLLSSFQLITFQSAMSIFALMRLLPRQAPIPDNLSTLQLRKNLTLKIFNFGSIFMVLINI